MIFRPPAGERGLPPPAAQRLTKTETASLQPRVALSATAAFVLWVDGDEYGGDVYLSSAAR
jgi:hypothetical protein